jgi:hypothetical protein
MTVVSLVPAHERPYVDGTRNDSLFSQVFDYNGIARLTGRHDLAALIQPAGFLVKLQHASLALNAASASIPADWNRLRDLRPGRRLALSRGADRHHRRADRASRGRAA